MGRDRCQARCAAITLISKATGAATTSHYVIGAGDPGAGQIYYPLSQGGREVGNLHAVNPGMLPSPARLPAFTSMRIGGRSLSCRFLADAELIAVTARRGVAILRDGTKLGYRSFDFARPGAEVHPDGVQRSNVPSATTGGGRAAGDRYTFASGKYRYVVALGIRPTLTAYRGTTRLQTERLLGFVRASHAD